MGIRSLLPGGSASAPPRSATCSAPSLTRRPRATVEAAWDQGIRYFDTAPFYGAGLAEIRLGDVLSAKPRDYYVLSTKVGRVILDEVEDPRHARPRREGRSLRARPPEQDAQRLHRRCHPALHRAQPQAARHRSSGHRLGARRRPGLLR